MRRSLIRSRLRQNFATRIACMYFPNAMMPAHAAQAGFDAIWLDAEHNTWDRREIQRMIAMHHLANIDCIVRTGSDFGAVMTALPTYAHTLTEGLK